MSMNYLTYRVCYISITVYLERDDDGLEVAAPPLDVVAHLLDVDVVQRSVDLVHHEEGGGSEAEHGEQTRKRQA